jgi:hypothetical protein
MIFDLPKPSDKSNSTVKLAQDFVNTIKSISCSMKLYSLVSDGNDDDLADPKSEVQPRTRQKPSVLLVYQKVAKVQEEGCQTFDGEAGRQKRRRTQ